MELELLAWGFGLVEGPRTDATGTLYFTDVTKGGVFRRSAGGTVENLIPDRPTVGGLALHADGGFVMSGPDIAHWNDGETRVILRHDDIKHWNDIQPDEDGSVLVGSIRSDLFDPKADKTPGECYRLGLDGSATLLYGGVEVSNGIGFSPDRRTLYHSDSTTKGLWAHDVAADGTVSNRRHIGREAFERGIPDGMCVDVDGNLWVAHVGGRRVAKLNPDGDLIGEIAVPAKAVTSVAFGGSDNDEMYIVTADNLDDASKGGSIFRARPGVAGVPTPLARV
ncbi:MAG: SMP-30/gluconolactonase/LRE family protein [Actinomycetota bacterium]|nr:SMP-30/gluconolactonase/LRE family protein [Actinomycetota bacterium]